MRTRYENKLKELNNNIISMNILVENSINRVIEVIKNRDLDLAKKIIDEDKKINELERLIEKTCLKLILKEQPVANDLKFISSIFKIITDLERIADHSADISGIFIELSKENTCDIIEEKIIEMLIKIKNMFDETIDSYTNKNLALARIVIKYDDIIDEEYEKFKNLLYGEENSLNYLLIGKYIEKMADHLVNISEWIIFYLTGVHRNIEIF